MKRYCLNASKNAYMEEFRYGAYVLWSGHMAVVRKLRAEIRRLKDAWWTEMTAHRITARRAGMEVQKLRYTIDEMRQHNKKGKAACRSSSGTKRSRDAGSSAGSKRARAAGGSCARKRKPTRRAS